MSIAAATFLVRDDGKVLVLRRGETAPWMPGRWDLPGGCVEAAFEMPDGKAKYETTYGAATRELYEEVGVTAKELRSVGNAIMVEGEEVYFYQTTKWEGDPEIGPEHQDMRWVTPGEAFRMNVVPGIKRALCLLRINVGSAPKD